MEITDEMVEALRRAVQGMIFSWDAQREFEQLLGGNDIEKLGHHVESLAATIDDVNEISVGLVREILEELKIA